MTLHCLRGIDEQTTRQTMKVRTTNILQTFHTDESGATATEYLVLLVLVACFIIGVVKLFGATLSEKYGWADQRVAKFVTF